MTFRTRCKRFATQLFLVMQVLWKKVGFEATRSRLSATNLQL